MLLSMGKRLAKAFGWDREIFGERERAASPGPEKLGVEDMDLETLENLELQD